ncbi:RagB/SusD family nutrient uptake outer membrane protein [Flavobacterium ovatum]|uniref:RagB/SusD family nutrient uptake outer membrane protein n=1 Tax=Flavobacterium ovatum TaxID=1928857 RepID=UPI0034506FE8
MVALLFFSFSSCEKDLLDTTPKTSIAEDDAYSTAGKMAAQVNYLYKLLQNQSFYGGRYIVFNEQRADEFGQNDGNAAAGSAVWNQNVGSTNDFVNNVWSVCYTAINASNILIDKLNTTTVVTDAVAKNYRAEARFVRALCYLSLVQTYAKPYALDKNGLGVPLRLTPVTEAGNNDLARSSIDVIYKQIVDDLDQAETDLPDSYSSSLLNVSRAKKSTAIALKTRVYLVQQKYDKVIDEAKKIVSLTAPYQYTSGTITHQLESSFNVIFTGSYTGNEALFSIPFANSTTETPASQSSLAFNYVGQPIIVLATDGIAKDPALNTTADARATLIATNSANQKILKKFNISTAPFRDYVPVIRYAEVLLNYAEAKAKNNDLTTAANVLTAVRNRSNPSYVFPTNAIDTQAALIATLWNERRIEFLGEGMRLMDLQRNLQTIPAKKGAIGTAPLVLVSSSNYIWPIPSGEISTNKLMVPNP